MSPAPPPWAPFCPSPSSGLRAPGGDHLTLTLCPHCGKTTEGEAADKGNYLLVACQWCHIILGVVPKYQQLVTFKDRPKDDGQD